MQTKLIIFCCALSAVIAYPFEASYEPTNDLVEPLDQVQIAAYPVDQPFHRVRRQFNANVGGTPGQGFGVNANARGPVWQSDNARHQFDLFGGYSQHLGGPYGNSPADVRGGGMYSYKW